MVITCSKCGARFEDEYRTTVCPHDAFLANDGHNNFAVHHDALLVPAKPLNDGDFALTQKALDSL